MKWIILMVGIANILLGMILSIASQFALYHPTSSESIERDIYTVGGWILVGIYEIINRMDNHK